MKSSNLKSSNYKIILPYNLLAEKVILGSILTVPESILVVSEKLPIEAFYLETHQILYKAILIIYAEGKTIDYINLITWMQDNGLLLKIGGAQMVLNLLTQLNQISNLEEYIGLVYEKYLRRSLIKLGEQIIEVGYLTELPLETIFRTIEQKFFLLSENKLTTNLISIEQGLTDILFEIEKGLRISQTPGLKTTFFELDILTQGFQSSELIIIAGRPSMGKTAFAFNIAKNIANNHQAGVIFFSLEMTRQQLLYRLLASEVEITNTRLRSSRLKKTEWFKIKKLIVNLSKLKLFIDDTPNLSVGEIKLKIKTLRFQKIKGIHLVIIDYLQLLEGAINNESRVQELTKITRELKKLARDLDIPVIVLSQLSRNVESRINKRPILADLRESGCLSLKKPQNIINFHYTPVFCWTGNYLELFNIVNVRLTGQKPIYRIETILGQHLFISSNHKIMTNLGWKKLDQLVYNNFIGIKLLLILFLSNNLNLTWDKIIKVTYEKLSPVYDFQISKISNYVASTVVLHNSIEQDADMVIMLYRDEYYNKETKDKDIIEVIIAKHRNGPIGTTRLLFDRKYLRFFNFKKI